MDHVGTLRIILSTATDIQIDKGVYYGYNLGTPLNCETKIPVVIKATNKNSRDTKAEDHAYDKLPTETPLIGYPRLYSSGWQNYSVRYLILEKLGPTLQAVLDRTPEKKLGDEKMILAVAIQVVSNIINTYSLTLDSN
jgi:hypothetical protein